MKNAIIGFFMIVILIFSAAAIQTAENRTTRKNELDTSLGEAMEQSMKILTIDPIYHIEKETGTEEFTADFIQGFLTKTTSNSEFTIEILNVDVEKGLLDVRAVERFRQVIGYGEVECRKTVILEDVKSVEKKYYSVSFLTNSLEEQKEEGETFVRKQFHVHAGDQLLGSMLPENGIERTGYTFLGWRMTKPVNGIGILYGMENIDLLYATDNLEFEAVYQKQEGV